MVHTYVRTYLLTDTPTALPFLRLSSAHQVDDHSMVGIFHTEAVSILKSTQGRVVLQLEKGALQKMGITPEPTSALVHPEEQGGTPAFTVDVQVRTVTSAAAPLCALTVAYVRTYVAHTQIHTCHMLLKFLLKSW